MEAVTVFAPRQPQATAPAMTEESDATRMLSVAVTYVLSEDGRKASLLAGGDGRAVQRLTVDVPANRLHLVTVDTKGVARLKLRPQYRREDGGIVRIDADPTYDTPPALDALFRQAAENYQLESAYHAQRQAATLKRREADRGRRMQVAQAFLLDRTQRALTHPAPTPKRCFIAADHGRILFDATKDDGPAKDVPAEAHRRFRADLRTRREQNQQARASQLALNEEKRRAAAQWIFEHGTPEQKARQEAGVLPLAEAIEAMTDQTFAALSDRPQYSHDGLARLQSVVREHPQHRNVAVTAQDLLVSGHDAPHMTAHQWAVIGEFTRLVPSATVTLRVHKLSWRAHPDIAAMPVFSIVVTQRVGPFTLRREYDGPTPEAGDDVRP